MGNFCAFSYPHLWNNMSENHNFDKGRTIKVSGISRFVYDQITIHFQGVAGLGGDVVKVHVCPSGEDCVLVEFSGETKAAIADDSKISKEVDIHNTKLTVEPYSMQPSSANRERVNKIWLDENGDTTSIPGDSYNVSSGKPPVTTQARRDANRNQRQNSTKEKRSAQVDQHRKLRHTAGMSEAFGNNSEAPFFEGTEVKLNDTLLENMLSVSHCAETNEILRKEEVKLDEKKGHLSGTWNAVTNVLSHLHSSIFGGEPPSSADDLRGDDNSGRTSMEGGIIIDSLLMRYIVVHYYEVFEQLEKVSSEIQYSNISASEKMLKAYAREGCEGEKFKKSVDSFIDRYQALHQDMHQEDILITGTDKSLLSDAISEARAQFLVIVFCDPNDANKATVYGTKDQAKKAARSIKEKMKVSVNSYQATNADGSIPRDHMSCPLSDKVKLFVYQGDITDEKVDAIVNPANEDLRHDGGAALKISRKGGRAIQSESCEIIKKRRRLQPGDVEITTAGNLPCHFVVHAVGPRWSNHPRPKCRDLLRMAVLGSLRAASYNKATSIAIPAISSGMFGMPVNLCAEILFNAVQEFVFSSGGSNNLTEIHFVNIDTPTVQVFQQEMKKRYKTAVTISQGEGSGNAPMNASVTARPSENIPFNDLSRKSSGTNTATSVFHAPLKIPSKNNPQQLSRAKKEESSGQKNKKGDKAFYQPPSGNPKSYSTAVTNGPKSSSGGETSDKPPQSPTNNPTAASKNSNPSNDKMMNGDTSDCAICLDVMNKPKTLEKCKHSFCTECIDNAFKHQKKCPLCSEVYGVLTGNQPPGTMTVRTDLSSLPGYTNCGTINIIYSISSGRQGSNHPSPGKPYIGTTRYAYLPNNEEGQKVVRLLKKAFDQKLTFTIGRSSTTGRDNGVIWNDIHHKTNKYGGPTGYGYPDPDYLRRVKEELAAKGITG